jgi:FtsH-binding integral membrane protein
MDSNYFAENAELNRSTVKGYKSVSIPTLIISVLTAVVFVLIIMNNWDNIIEMMGMEQEIIETEGLEKLTV